MTATNEKWTLIVALAVVAAAAFFFIKPAPHVFGSETVLVPLNSGCEIKSPDDKPLDISDGDVIPKGSTISGSCFASKMDRVN